MIIIIHMYACSQETLVTILEQAAECLVKGERYEVLGEVFKLIIPIYESAREFEVSQVSN